MTDARYALSHAILAGATVWCAYNSPESWRWMYASYSAIGLYSLIGIWRYGNPEYGDDSADCYATTFKVVQSLAFPCFVSEIYVHYGYDLQIAALHSGAAIIPLGLDLLKNDWEQDLVDTILLGNIFSGCTLSILKENYFGIAVNVNYLFTHFVLKNKEISDVPSKILYNIGLCFYLFYAYRTLSESCMA